jgi:hypothetical protein
MQAQDVLCARGSVIPRIRHVVIEVSADLRHVNPQVGHCVVQRV